MSHIRWAFPMLFTDHRGPEIASPLPEMSILESFNDELLFFQLFLICLSVFRKYCWLKVQIQIIQNHKNEKAYWNKPKAFDKIVEKIKGIYTIIFLDWFSSKFKLRRTVVRFIRLRWILRIFDCRFLARRGAFKGRFKREILKIHPKYDHENQRKGEFSDSQKKQHMKKSAFENKKKLAKFSEFTIF